MGPQTLERFHYQYAYTAKLALEMVLQQNQFKEILCELHEDILGVLEDNKFVGIQVKTRDLSLGPFRYTDEPIKKSIWRFTELEKKFSNYFKAYIIVSNCGFSKNPSNSILHLIRQAQTPTQNKFDDPSKHFINRICSDWNVSESILVTVLQKLDCYEGPSLHDIDNTIIGTYLPELQKFSQVTLFQFREIFQRMIVLIHNKSKISIPEVIHHYSEFLKNKEITAITEIVNEKRITKETIETILKNGLKFPYLKLTDTPILKINKDSYELMKKKMGLGGIDSLVIENMKDLMFSAEYYVTQELHRGNDINTEEEKIEHVLAKIQNDASEIYSRQKQDSPFGSNMLHSIEERLRQISNSDSSDAFRIPYEILKGFMGILTASCRIQFSKKPTEGFT